MAKNNVHTVRGTAMYAKVLGAPVYNKFAKDNEWTIDLVISNDTTKEIKGLGIGDRVKKKEGFADGKPYLHFKQKELTAKGNKNEPIKVTDIFGNPWPDDKLIGNGSVIDIQFALVPYEATTGVYPRTIRILDHVPYAGGGMEKLSEDDVYLQKALAAQEALQATSGTSEAEEVLTDDDEL